MSKAQPVQSFFQSFMKPTGSLTLKGRTEELDERLKSSGLNLTDKVEVFRLLSPTTDLTTPRKELRMERLLLSVLPADLPLFKFSLEYDRDYKDMAEYLFHDIDDTQCRLRAISHLRQAPADTGVKALTDVDDTMYANLIDERYPKKTLYPGVLEFYDSIYREPFAVPATPITTLSARPNPVAGTFEESSLDGIVKKTGQRLLPSALSGELVSGAAGSLVTWIRANANLLGDRLPHGAEDQIGKVKFENFSVFAEVYPEYKFVFVGDSGQADALTAQLMLTQQSAASSRVITTFIHDLRESAADVKAVSHTFRGLPAGILTTRQSTGGRGVVVFRNYIDAAIVAHVHSQSTGILISARELARITKAALVDFLKIDFTGKEESRARLLQQYREDAEEALEHLTAGQTPAAIETEVREIRQLVDGPFIARRAATS